MSYIPADIEQFILDRIESVAQLEALLLLRSEPEGEWNSNRLSERLYIAETEMPEILDGLCRGGFLTAAATEQGPFYRYAPRSNELRQMVDRLADSYARHLVPITNLIHSKSKTRVQEFADAFRLRKDK